MLTALTTLLLSATVTSAQDLYYVGSDGSWSNADNWSTSPDGQGDSGLPNENTSVHFLSSSNVIITEDQAFEVSNVFINAPSFSTEGSLVIHQSLSIHGDSYVQNGIEFVGTAEHSISAVGQLFSDLNLSGDCSLESPLLLGKENNLSIDSGSFTANNKAITLGGFNAENSHTELLLSGTKIIVQDHISVHPSIDDLNAGSVFWISSGVPVASVETGQFGYSTENQRTASCGNEPGETPFTIDAIVISDYNGKDISCNGAEDGEAFVTINGGVGPFTFSWIGADETADTQNFPDLGPGTYTVVVTDLGQDIICIDEVGFVEPSPITLASFSETPPSCDGLCNGSANAIVVGGTPGYTLDWSSGDSGSNASMICEGPNTFVATDLNGCTLTEEFTSVLEPIIANVEITNITCNGTANGAATSTPSGGEEPYSFSWSTAADVDNTINGQNAGTVTLTIIDNSGCSVDTTFEITEEPLLEITLLESQDESCSGLSDGFISIDLTGGTPNYTTTWTSDLGFTSSDEDIVNLLADNYTVVVEDANGCQQTTDFSISAPPAIQVDADLTPVSCFNGSNGAISLSISGGTPGYTLNWDGGFGGNNPLEGLITGNYSATIIDDNDCELEVNYELDQPDEIVINGLAAQISCFGDNNGSIEVDISGGTPDYTTSWTGPSFVSSNEDISGLSAGTYNLQVLDELGCTGQFSGEIIEPETMEISTLVEPISCPGASDASIEIIISGGTPNFIFSWTGPNAFNSVDQNISMLEAGSYDLLVTDDQGCTVEATVILNAPEPLVIIPDVTDASCGGLSDGEIDLSVLGGTPGYTFDWIGINGFTSDQEDITGLESGPYSVTITDLEGCSTDIDLEVSETPELEATITPSDITCFGENDAEIDLEIIGGQPNYNVNWSGPNLFTSSDEDIVGLEPGTYNLLIIDQNGCFLEDFIQFTEPDEILVDQNVVDPSCFGEEDGSIELFISGGVDPYTITWAEGFNGEVISDLPAGDYNATIVDDSGCEIQLGTISLITATEIEIDLVGTDILCSNESTGAITTTISGGIPDYTILWSGPDGFTSEQVNLSNLAAGNYSLLVIDSSGCEGQASIDITEPEEINIDSTISDALCSNDPIDIDIVISGGIPDYTVSWTGPNGFTSDQTTLSNLEQGAYSLIILDAEGCEFTQDFDLAIPDPLTVVVDLQNLDCSGVNNGSIELDITGGTPDYAISWSGPNDFVSDQFLIDDLEEGTYSLQVQDANLCLFEQDYELLQPEGFELTSIVTSPLCNLENTGSIDIEVTGGDGNYTFVWTGPNSFGSAAEDISNLIAGDYTINIEDGGNCTFETTINVGETPELEVNDTTSPELCSGEENGTATLDILGGTPDYSVIWSGPSGFASATQNITGLAAGDYSYEVFDANLCMVVGSITIEEGFLIELTTDSENTSCNEANGEVSVVVSGGEEPYDIAWVDSDLNTVGTTETVGGLTSGAYSVLVIDDFGCTASSTATISDSDAIEITGTTMDPLCDDASNGTIFIEATGGIGNFTYDWVGPDGFSSDQEVISDLAAGTYVIEITDESGCIAAESFELFAPESLSASSTVQNVSCFGQNDGSIELVISGGTPDYLVSWTGPNGFVSDQNTINNLEPGLYELSILDANLCLFENNFEISENNELVLSVSNNDFLCFGFETGSIDLTISGGSAPYEILWTGSNGFSSINEDLINLASGEYTCNVLDESGCSAELVVLIEENPELEISIDETQPACLSSDGQLLATVIGGTPGYNYFWYDLDNGNTLLGITPEITDLSAGNYLIEAFDDRGCPVSANIALSDASGSIGVENNDVLCFDDFNGSIDATVEGAELPYSVEWTGPDGFTSDQEDIADLAAGDYVIQVVDALGCVFSEVVAIEEPEELAASATPGNPLCGGDVSGAILLNITGGIEPFAVTWVGPNGFASDQQNIADLEEGCYDYQITDDNGCQIQGQSCLVAPPELEVQAVLTNVDCFGESTGNIALLTNGGISNYSWNWSGPNMFSADTESLQNIEAGQYDLQVTDPNMCQLDTFFVITESTEIDIELQLVPPTCPNSNNAELSLVVEGGSPTYDLFINGPSGFEANTSPLFGLETGIYTIEVTDQLMCSQEIEISIEEPDSIQITGTVTNVLCFETNNGTIALELEGGTSPYTFDWAGPNGYNSDQQNISDLEPGSYEVVVSDFFLCSSTAQFEVEEAIEIDITVDLISNASCVSSNDGAIEVSVEGGQEDYSFSWAGPDGYNSINEDITDLFAGEYDLNVTDSNGCTEQVQDLPIIGLGDVTAVAPVDSSWCFGSSVLLLGNNTGADAEGWRLEDGTQVSDSASFLVDFEPGEYVLTYFAVDGPCEDMDQISIQIFDAGFADAGEDQFIYADEQAFIGADEVAPESANITWSPGSFLLDSTEFNPLTIPLLTEQEFVLTTITENGCRNTDSITVFIIPEIEIPDGFTPNNDGMNDNWVLGNISFYPSTTVSVYNRWGEQLYYSKGDAEPWDGLVDGNPLPIGTYYYVIDVNEPDFTKEITGPITIMR